MKMLGIRAMPVNFRGMPGPRKGTLAAFCKTCSVKLAGWDRPRCPCCNMMVSYRRTRGRAVEGVYRY